MSALYDRSVLGTANNQIIFNDESSSTYSRVRQTDPVALQIREEDVPIPNQSGIADYQSLEGKSYFTIDGIMYPNGEDAYYRGRELLRNIASLEIANADPLSDNGYVPYVWGEANRQRMLWVKVERVDGLGESTKTGFQQPFSFYCKVKTPVIYDVNAVTTVLGVNTTGTVIGASGYSFSYPVLYGATTYASNGTVYNAGSLGAYPTFNIYGPTNLPRITNLTTGEYIEVNVNLPTTSDFITISYDNDTPPVVQQAGQFLNNKVSSGSTFFKMKPGQNQLQLTGASLSNGANATVSFYSSYPLG